MSFANQSKLKFILLILVALPQIVFSHSLGPAWQDVKTMTGASNIMFYVDASNVRKDVSKFTLTVQDFDTGEQVGFSSSDRIFTLKDEQAKRIRVFVKNEGRKRLKICTWATSTVILNGNQQTISSAVCSGVRLQYF
jgi:hypothetical protein